MPLHLLRGSNLLDIVKLKGVSGIYEHEVQENSERRFDRASSREVVCIFRITNPASVLWDVDHRGNASSGPNPEHAAEAKPESG